MSEQCVQFIFLETCVIPELPDLIIVEKFSFILQYNLLVCDYPVIPFLHKIVISHQNIN